MDEGLVMVIGMTIAYVASFIGLGLAWWAWRRRVDDDHGVSGPPDETEPRGGAGLRGSTGPRDQAGPPEDATPRDGGAS